MDQQSNVGVASPYAYMVKNTFNDNSSGLCMERIKRSNIQTVRITKRPSNEDYAAGVMDQEKEFSNQVPSEWVREKVSFKDARHLKTVVIQIVGMAKTHIRLNG